MKKQTIETPVTAETLETVEPVLETSAIEPPQSRIAAALAYVKGTPKWVMMTVPALVVAFGGYSYLQQGDKSAEMAGSTPQAALVGHAAQPQGFVPVAYDPNYGPANGNYGHYGRGDAYGNGNGAGRAYGQGHGNGRASGHFGFSMGGDMSGAGNGYGNGNGGGNGYGHNRYNNGYYY